MPFFAAQNCANLFGQGGKTYCTNASFTGRSRNRTCCRRERARRKGKARAPRRIAPPLPRTPIYCGKRAFTRLSPALRPFSASVRRRDTDGSGVFDAAAPTRDPTNHAIPGEQRARNHSLADSQLSRVTSSPTRCCAAATPVSQACYRCCMHATGLVPCARRSVFA
jgi:hypothetical protein